MDDVGEDTMRVMAVIMVPLGAEEKFRSAYEAMRIDEEESQIRENTGDQADFEERKHTGTPDTPLVFLARNLAGQFSKAKDMSSVGDTSNVSSLLLRRSHFSKRREKRYEV